MESVTCGAPSNELQIMKPGVDMKCDKQIKTGVTTNGCSIFLTRMKREKSYTGH